MLDVAERFLSSQRSGGPHHAAPQSESKFATAKSDYFVLEISCTACAEDVAQGRV